MNRLIDVERRLPFSCGDCKYYEGGVSNVPRSILFRWRYTPMPKAMQNRSMDNMVIMSLKQTKEREVLRSYEEADI